LGCLAGHWWGLHPEYPQLEDTFLDEIAALDDVVTMVKLEGMSDREYRQRLRAAIILHVGTLGERLALKLLNDHPAIAIMTATYTLDVAGRLNSLETPYALPCFLNTVSNLSIHIRPSDPDQGMRDVMTYLEITQEAQDGVMEAFSAVAPVIH
jgi:hypothetical protein